VRLQDVPGGEAVSVLTLRGPASSEACTSWCREEPGCRQAVFSLLAKGCYLYSSATAEVRGLRKSYLSSYCGEDVHRLENMSARARSDKPERPLRKECSWMGDNCSKTGCCKEPVRSYFEGRTGPKAGLKCFETNGTWATCAEVCYPAHGRSCRVLGGIGTSIEVDSVPKGSSAVKGTSLFCVTAAVSGRYLSRGTQISEEELLKAQKDHGIGVFACDGHLTLRGHRASSDGGWSSYLNNVGAFLGHWEAIKKEGRWKKYEWTVKLDADTVFFPDRLKEHLRELRTPKGAKVYVRNTGRGWQFSGALEILTAEATAAFFERGGECAEHLDRQGAEDRYMKLCLDAIGVDYQSDYGVLREGAAASEDMCMDPWAAAFHPFKTRDEWLKCHHAQMAYRTLDRLGRVVSASKGQTLLDAGAAEKDLISDPAAIVDTTTALIATVAATPINRTTITASSTTGTVTTATSGTTTTSALHITATTTSSETATASVTLTTTWSETVTMTSTWVTASTSTHVSSTHTTTASSMTGTDTQTTTGSSITGTGTATTGSLTSLRVTVTTAPYDCQEGIDAWKEWLLAKSAWCCQNQKIGCVGSERAEPYDCQDGLADWKSSWVLQKSVWCCRLKGLGCIENQPHASAAGPRGRPQEVAIGDVTW
jgi:hypothetical protein